jgi:hypothetical protein
MYWRVKRLDPDYLFRKYGVYIIVAISVPMNLIQFATRPNLNKILQPDTKVNFDQFARQVTTQLLDTSYITFESNTRALLSGELAPSVQQLLLSQEALPKTPEEMKALVQQYTQTREVRAVRIDDVALGDPNEQGLVPVEVRGVVAKHSAEEGGQQEIPFDIKYLIGQNSQTQKPIVAQISGL